MDWLVDVFIIYLFIFVLRRTQEYFAKYNGDQHYGGGNLTVPKGTHDHLQVAADLPQYGRGGNRLEVDFRKSHWREASGLLR